MLSLTLSRGKTHKLILEPAAPCSLQRSHSLYPLPCASFLARSPVKSQKLNQAWRQKETNQSAGSKPPTLQQITCRQTQRLLLLSYAIVVVVDLYFISITPKTGGG